MLTRAVCILPWAVCILPGQYANCLGSMHTIHFLAHGQYRYSGNMLTDTVSDISSASHLADAGGRVGIKRHPLT